MKYNICSHDCPQRFWSERSKNSTHLRNFSSPLEGSTESPEPPRDPPQQRSLVTISRTFLNSFLILHYLYLLLTIQFKTILYLDTSRLRGVQARSKYLRVFLKYKDLRNLQVIKSKILKISYYLIHI